MWHQLLLLLLELPPSLLLAWLLLLRSLTPEVSPDAVVSVWRISVRECMLEPLAANDLLPVAEDLFWSPAEVLLETPDAVAPAFRPMEGNRDLIGGRPSAEGDAIRWGASISSFLHVCIFCTGERMGIGF